MNEDEFWKQLRFRIYCAGSLKEPLPGYLDWFTPRRYVFDGPSPRITGKVGFVNGRDVIEMDFTLFLNSAAGSVADIEWANLLPPEESTGWLSFDTFHNRIEIDPSCGR